MNSKSDVSVEKGETESEKFSNKNNEKFPKSAIFILVNVLFDRFSSGGIMGVLALYLHQKLNYDSDQATALYHTNECIQYLFTIIGAVIADAFFGVFKTISFMTLVFALGSGLLAIGSIDFYNFPIKIFSLTGLFILVAASGAVKTNQNVMGGNQFQLPEQANHMNRFFSLIYLMSKCGMLMGQLLFPVISKDFKCFGHETCYPISFIIATVVMLISFVVFVSGKSFYKEEQKRENMFMKVCACMISAVHRRFTDKSTENPKKHWLDYSEKLHDINIVDNTKEVLKFLKILSTLPMFWAIYSQCNSRWVFQANQMNGDLGFYKVKPDQMVILTTIFSIISVPLADYIIYPLMSKVGIKTNLQKVTVGMSLSVLSFIGAAIVEIVIQKHFISMLWLMPQYFLIANAEVFLWISMLNFIFSKAPTNLKSVITSILYLTSSAGSLIIIFVSGLKLFDSQFVEFISFASAMTLNTILFVFMARNYEKKTLI